MYLMCNVDKQFVVKWNSSPAPALAYFAHEV